MSEQLYRTQTAETQDAKTEDLQDLQIHINLATQNVRHHGVEHLPVLNQFLGELDRKIAEADGLYIAGLQVNGQRASANDKLLEAHYSLGTDNFDNQLLYIPKTCITAHQTNPQFYGTGHDASPVLNLRVLRIPGQPAQDHTGRHIPDTEMWFQVPINETSLAIHY